MLLKPRRYCPALFGTGKQNFGDGDRDVGLAQGRSCPHANSQSFRVTRAMKAKTAGDTDGRGSGSIGLQSVPSAVRLLRLRFGQRVRARLLVLLHTLESLFKLRDQRSFVGLETVACHDAPEKIASRPLMGIVYGHQIFGTGTRASVCPNSEWRPARR